MHTPKYLRYPISILIDEQAYTGLQHRTVKVKVKVMRPFEALNLETCAVPLTNVSLCHCVALRRNLPVAISSYQSMQHDGC